MLSQKSFETIKKTTLPLLTIVYFLAGCQTGRISVTSNPVGSDVFVVSQSGAKQRLGKTPVDFATSRLNLTPGTLAEIRIESQNYTPATYLVPYTALSSSHDISANLSKMADDNGFSSIDSCDDISRETINEIGKSIATVQALILKKDLEVAIVRASSAIAKYPYVSVLYDLQGNIYYLQKNYVKALSSFKKSMSIDPKNLETNIMVKRLKELTGIK